MHVLPEGDGFGHRGVLQGSPEDDPSGARMLFDQLMLGDDEPQVIAFALEQENLYYAPSGCRSCGGADLERRGTARDPRRVFSFGQFELGAVAVLFILTALRHPDVAGSSVGAPVG
ncbi:hypothetical protein [Streptomyces yanii]|uniref:hypothetical protein n=1 Tax=Streptomyces yanii TaxID=78510 RepID=UPI0031E8FA80